MSTPLAAIGCILDVGRLGCTGCSVGVKQHKQSLFGLSFSLGLCLGQLIQPPPSDCVPIVFGGEVEDDVVLVSLSDRLVEEDAEDNSTVVGNGENKLL